MNETSKILIIDDEYGIRDTLSFILGKEGYEVATSETGEEGIEKLKHESFNVVITDIKMPGIDGVTVLERVKSINPDIAVIIITAYASIDSSIRAVKAGAAAYLTKPINIEELKTVISEALKKQRLVLENKRLLLELREANIELKEANKYIGLERDRLREMLQLSHQMSSILNFKDLVMFMIRQSVGFMNAKRGLLFLVDKDGKLRLYGQKGLSKEVRKGLCYDIGEGIFGYVARTQKPLLFPDIREDSIFSGKRGSEYLQGSVMCLPIRSEKRLVGVMALSEKREGGEFFNEDDLRLISIVCSQFVSMVENTMLYEKTRQLSITDPLTKVYNRRYCEQYLQKEIDRTIRYNRPLSLVMFDIDHFKNYNDKNGHLMGDKVLQKIAEVLKEKTRRVDIVARFGGEEFVLILPETSLSEAKVVAEKIRQCIERESFEHEHLQPGGRLTISGGVAEWSKGLSTQKEFLDTADKALYQAKERGRNMICVYKEEDFRE